MPVPLVGTNQFLARFENKTIPCDPYAIAKLGVDNCTVKIDKYMIQCAPYQFGFKKSLYVATLSNQEMIFFQKYVNGIVALSISFLPKKKTLKPVTFLIHCGLIALSPVKGRENTGLFELEHKKTPDDFVNLLGNFLDVQNRNKDLYEVYSSLHIKISAETAAVMGYNNQASIVEPNAEPRRIQVYQISSKRIEHLEAAGGSVIAPGSSVVYRLFFQKYRITVSGVVEKSEKLSNGLVKTDSSLAFSPQLVEILDDYHTAKPKT
jgi:hypothetical protein